MSIVNYYDYFPPEEPIRFRIPRVAGEPEPTQEEMRKMYLEYKAKRELDDREKQRRNPSA